jgi:cation/acetate symporter
MVVLALCLALGVASMPHILMRSATAGGVGAARLSAGWALLFVLIIIATAPAYAAFARLAHFARPSAGLSEADAVVLALPSITNLPPAMTGLIAVGALAAILAAATAQLFSIAQTIGHDFYGGIIDRTGPSGRRLIDTRIFLIAVACLAGWYAAHPVVDIFRLAATSLSLAASGLFPALLLGIWWKRATAWGTLIGMLFGSAAAAVYVAMVLYGDLMPWRPLGSAGSGLPPMAAAFFGVPIGFLTIFLVSLITPKPVPERIKFVEALRRPTSSPLFDA